MLQEKYSVLYAGVKHVCARTAYGRGKYDFFIMPV